MTLRPTAAQPFTAPWVPELGAVPVTLPRVSPPPGAPGLTENRFGGQLLTPDALIRRYESLAENIAQAAQRPNGQGGQLATLANLRHLGLLSAEEHDARAAGLRAHCTQHAALPYGTDRVGLGVANHLWKVVHPARLCWGAAWNRFVLTGSPTAYLRLHLALQQHPSRPEAITFYTDDNVQLSGLVVRAGGPGKPMMLMVSGNAGCAEAEFETARKHVHDFDVDVMLYNPRGVGLSLGDVTHPGQALLDCTAAIRKAVQYSERLCVWGCSLGGALTTQALRAMRADGDPALDKLEFTVCLNSFPSLPSIIGHLVAPRWLPRSWGRGASSGTLSVMGIDPLESCRTLSRHRLGVPTLVCNSTNDEMMHGPSSLADALLDSGKELPADLEVVRLDAGGHNEYPQFFEEPAYQNALARWRGL